MFTVTSKALIVSMSTSAQGFHQYVILCFCIYYNEPLARHLRTYREIRSELCRNFLWPSLHDYRLLKMRQNQSCVSFPIASISNWQLFFEFPHTNDSIYNPNERPRPIETSRIFSVTQFGNRKKEISCKH